MRFAAPVLTALVASVLISAAPVKRQASSNDKLVLQFAHVLEQLETQFYSEALAKFTAPDFNAAGFSDANVPVQQFVAIQADEATHTVVLEQTLLAVGAQPITGCQFNFDSVLTSVSAMAPVARLVENLGVGAYLGAAHLLDDAALLTAAASIATVEARHQTVLNLLNGGSAIPQAFDIPFSPSQVLAIASPFISGCDLGIPANPTLSITNTGSVGPGTSLTFSSAALNGSVPDSSMFCQMLVGGAPGAIVLPFSQCVVPSGINGPVAITITKDDQPLSLDPIVDPGNLIAGPTMAFIDTVTDSLASTSRSGSGSSGSSGSSSSGSSGSSSSSSASSDQSTATTTSAATATQTDSGASSAQTSAASQTDGLTTTITPGEASSIISSVSAASATASASPSAGGNNAAQGATSLVDFPGGPNNYKGPVSNGTLEVLGWKAIPKPQ
ncbi:hypothetical protein BDW22DRAFT_1341935 [Trametopsis cervina]|nr:hypothetical protein BDW22DRAFT_1341935 [Trametopsis cervina]